MERPHRLRPDRLGFTLVELLVAILIIGALLGILLPTVFAAFRKAREATVAAEMNNLATALASFKNTYGDYPPSRIILSEEGFTATFARAEFTTATVIPGADSSDTDMTYTQLAQRSLTYLQKFWPRADFRGNPGTSPLPGQFNDFNGDRVMGDPVSGKGYYIINGSECLTFFLGGIPIFDSSKKVTGLSGFSKSPTHPFVDSGPIPGQSNLYAPNRTVPNYEFNNGRLQDQDKDHIPSYLDPLDQVPGSHRSYAYFSAYGTNQYDPNDVNGYGYDDLNNLNNLSFEKEDDDTTFVERGFSVFFPTSSGSPYYAKSPAPNPYTTGAAALASTGAGASGAISWYNPNSFQLLSSGQDRLWGLGGTYIQTSSGGSRLPLDPNDPGLIHSTDTVVIRLRESDNITNFSAGRLE